MAALARSGHNTMLLDPKAVGIDLLTDSWGELPTDWAEIEAADAGGVQPEDALHGFYGYRFAVPVFQGRYAEALLAKALLTQKGAVVTNALFPTTRHHLQANGAELLEMPIPEAYDPCSEHPFKGNLDIEGLKRVLQEGGVRAVYMELCVNALGGQPVSLANLSEVYALASGHRVPVALDVTRAFDNACLIREREAGLAGKSLSAIVRALCACSDACAASLTKDFVCPRGAFIGVNCEKLFVPLRDMAKLAYGDGLCAADRERMAAALFVSPEGESSVAGRVALSRKLWTSLRDMSVPVSKPAGGHGVFVDVRGVLPQLAEKAHPGTALVNEMFVAGGIRAAPNLVTPEQKRRDVSLVRLAIPVGHYREDIVDSVAEALSQVAADADRIKGLARVDHEPGMLGQYLARYRPIRESDFQEGTTCSLS